MLAEGWYYGKAGTQNVDGPYPTKDKAAEQGNARAFMENWPVFFVGRFTQHRPLLEEWFLATEVIDHLMERAENLAHLGEGPSLGNWLENVSKKDRRRLNRRLAAAVEKWLTETDNWPTTKGMVDVEEHQTKRQW